MPKTKSSTKTTKYDRKLENLGKELYTTRQMLRGEEADATALANEIKEIFTEKGMTEYDGKTVIIQLVPVEVTGIDLQAAIQLYPLETLFRHGLLTVNREAFEAYVSSVGGRIPVEVYTPIKQYTRVDVKPKVKP